MTKYHTLNYQNLIIKYQNRKSLGNKMRDLLEIGVKSCTLTPKGIEYYTHVGYFDSNSIPHCDQYPKGVIAERINPRIYDQSCRLKVNVKKMHEFLGSDPIPPRPTAKPIHRGWMTPEQYERTKQENPTLATSIL